MQQESAVRLRNSRVTFWRKEGELFIRLSPSGDKQCSELWSPSSGCSRELHTHSQSHLQSVQHAPSRLRSGRGSGCRRPCAGDHCDLRDKSHWPNSLTLPPHDTCQRVLTWPFPCCAIALLSPLASFLVPCGKYKRFWFSLGLNCLNLRANGH